MSKKAEGYVLINNKKYLYYFENGVLSIISEMFDSESKPILEQNFVARRFGYLTPNEALFHTSFPILLGFPSIINSEVDWYIDDYRENAKYSMMEFTFPELRCFANDMGNLHINKNNYVFSAEPKEITSFNFEFMGETVNAIIESRCDICMDIYGSSAKTDTYLRYCFPETEDINFLLCLYRFTDNIFSFLCNRRNVAIDSAAIFEIRKIKIKEDDKIENKIYPTISYLHIVDKYRERRENDKVISRTITFPIVKSHIKGLFDFAALNYQEGGESLSINSIHASENMRRHIDFRHTLQIVAAFEFYQREFLPEISSASSIEAYGDIKKLLDKYILENSGKKKEAAKDIIKHIQTDIPLKDKLKKAYYGYKNWKSLEPVLSDRFGNDITDLASIANDWRNDLAHEKRKFKADLRTINAVHLVEHINYCIVLRRVGYSDAEIKEIVEKILYEPIRFCQNANASENMKEKLHI